MTHGMTPTPLFLSVCQPLGLSGSDIYVTGEGDENENGNYPNDLRGWQTDKKRGVGVIPRVILLSGSRLSRIV